MRRDLRLGSTAGQIFMTSEGMLILRATFRSLFGKPEFIMEVRGAGVLSVLGGWVDVG